MLICIATIPVLAQEEKKQVSQEECYFTFDLLSQANVLNPRWRIGYIHSLNDKWKLGMDVGLGRDAINLYSNSDKSDFKIWELRPEIYYVIKSEKKMEKYISAELFYTQETSRLLDEEYDAKEQGYYYFDSADFQRKKYGVNFKFGYFFNLNKNWGLNVYSGLGFRIRENQYSNIMNPILHEDADRLFINSYQEKEGKDNGLNFSLGIKIYLLK